MKTNQEMKTTQKIKMAPKWRRSKKWRWHKNEDSLKIEDGPKNKSELQRILVHNEVDARYCRMCGCCFKMPKLQDLTPNFKFVSSY